MTTTACDICGESSPGATIYCPSCEQPTQCEECCAFLHSKKARKDHKHIPLSEWQAQKKGDVKRTCTDHPDDPIKLYCADCSSLVCLKCITSTHAGHKCSQILEEVEPLSQNLSNKRVTLQVKKVSFENEMAQVKETYALIQQETEQTKDIISKSIGELIGLLRKKEVELAEEFCLDEAPKLKALDQQTDILVRNIKKTEGEIEKIASTENLKGMDSMTFVIDAVDLIKELEKVTFEPVHGKPVVQHGSYKNVMTNLQKRSIASLELVPPVDFWKSSIQSPKFTFIEGKEWSYDAVVSLRNFEGNPFKLPKEFALSCQVEGPIGSKVEPVEFLEAHALGHYSMRAKGDLVGEYRFKVTFKGVEIQGSPFSVIVKPSVPTTLDVPLPCSNFLAFSQVNKEYCVVQKQYIKCFQYPDTSKTREVKLPWKAHYMCFNEEGDMYAVDPEKIFMTDRSFKEIWKAQLKEGQIPRGISYDGKHLYVVFAKGQIHKYSLSGEHISYFDGLDLVDPKNMVFYENLFVVPDENMIKLFCHDGVLRQTVACIEPQCVCVINEYLYHAPANSKTWKKLSVNPDWEKKAEVKQNSAKDLDKKEDKDPLDDETKKRDSNSKKEDIKKPTDKIKEDAKIENKGSRFGSFFGAIATGKVAKPVKVSLQESETVGKVKVQNELTGHLGKINSVCITPSGDMVISGSDSEIKVWDYATGDCVDTLPYGCRYLYTSGVHIFAAGVGKIIRVFLLKDRTLTREITVEEEVECLYATLDLRGLFTGSASGALSYHDYQKPNGGSVVLGKHADSITCIAPAKDGRSFFTGSNDGSIKVWGMDGKEIKIIKGHTGPVRSVCTSFDGQLIISSSDDKTIRVWSGTTHKNTKIIKTKTKVGIVAPTPNSAYVVAGGENAVHIFKLESGTEKIAIPLKDSPRALCVDTAARYIVTYDQDKVSILSTNKHPDPDFTFKSPRGEKKEKLSTPTDKKDEGVLEPTSEEEKTKTPRLDEIVAVPVDSPKKPSNKNIEAIKVGDKEPETRESLDGVKDWLED